MVATQQGPVVGVVEVEGERYQLTSISEHGYQAVRVADSSLVGSFTMTPGDMWKMDSDAPELMHAIVQEAMTVGLVATPPTD